MVFFDSVFSFYLTHGSVFLSYAFFHLYSPILFYTVYTPQFQRIEMDLGIYKLLSMLVISIVSKIFGQHLILRLISVFCTQNKKLSPYTMHDARDLNIQAPV